MAIVSLNYCAISTVVASILLALVLQLPTQSGGQKLQDARDEFTNTGDQHRGKAIASAPNDVITQLGSLKSHSDLSPKPAAKSKDGRNNPEPRFYLGESTKLIYIDKTSESGYLIGNIDSDNDGETTRAKTSQKGNSAEIIDRLHKNWPKNHSEGSKPTNYSVFLVSRSKEHIAIQIEIEEIDFEPIINCEYQEIRFSIVGEISKQLLSWKNGNMTVDENMPADEDENKDETTSEQQPAASESSAEPAIPPLPVSEAMAALLNAPLNKTILDQSEETNDFRIIDSTIDFLHEETCHELEQNKLVDKLTQQQSRKSGTGSRARAGSRKRGHHEQVSAASARNNRRARRRQSGHGRNKCPQESPQFKEIMSNKLHDFFEWDDFKIVCGKTRQLLIPMRSLKISIYSDEFSPASRFAIKYKFIKDASELPGQDSGKYYCRNRNVVDISLKCDGVDDCGDASDESIKVCGYPTGQSTTTQAGQSQNSAASSNSSSLQHSSGVSGNRKKLTYVNGDVLHCCQSNDWMSVIPTSQANQMINLIGESMNLFSAPLFAPTKSGGRRRAKRVKRIVGGGVAQRGAWPGQASLQYELLEPLCHFCAGTLIHPQYVLTAGHCITKDGLNRGIKVVFGAHDLRQLNGNHIQVRYVDDAQIYPGVDVKHLNFDWENDMNNDIALLRLNAPVLITANVAPACLPPFNTPLAVNTTCRSIGWGQTHGSGSSNLLKHLTLKVVNSSLCSKELFDRDNDTAAGNTDEEQPSELSGGSRSSTSAAKGRAGRLVSDFESAALDQYSDLTMVCVNNDMGHGICQGDSGGPLYCDRISQNGEQCTEIYGVASFIIQYATVGAMCAVENLPGIFGEVSSKTEWISSTMKMFEQTYRLKYS